LPAYISADRRATGSCGKLVQPYPDVAPYSPESLIPDKNSWLIGKRLRSDGVSCPGSSFTSRVIRLVVMRLPQGYRKLKLMSLSGNVGPDLNSCDSWLKLSWRGIALSHGYHLPQLVDGGLPIQAAEVHAFMLTFQDVFQLESSIMGLATVVSWVGRSK
jgi:hypothetical protein